MSLLRRRLAWLHLWTGVILALPLLVIALSGSLLLFREIVFVPAAWSVDPARTVQDRQFDAELARLISRHAGSDLSVIYVARGRRGFHMEEWSDGRYAFVPLGSAGPVADPPARLNLESTLYYVHTELLAGPIGDWIVTILAPIAVATLCVGVWLWWPGRRAWRARHVLPQTATRTSWVRGHYTFGALAVLVVFVQVATGALLTYNVPIRAWLAPHWSPRATLAAPFPAFEPGNSREALAAARALLPDGVISQLIHTRDERETWTLKMRLPGERHVSGRSSVTFDLAAGEITKARDARLGGAPAMYDDWIYPLHLGEILGPAHRWLWLCGAAALLFLIVTGVAAFLLGRRRRAVDSGFVDGIR